MCICNRKKRSVLSKSRKYREMPKLGIIVFFSLLVLPGTGSHPFDIKNFLEQQKQAAARDMQKEIKAGVVSIKDQFNKALGNPLAGTRGGK